MNKRIFIVIPSYNEGAVIRQTILSLSNQYEIVVVDDASRDDTYARISDLPIYYLQHDINLGQGAALQTGMTFALQEGADIVVHFDADGQHNAGDITRFIHELENTNADIILGSRFLREIDRTAIPPLRRILLQAGRFVNGMLTGLWLSDAHNGFRVMNRHALSSIQLRENRMAHATEILMQIKRQKLRYVECPTHIEYTEYSKVKGQRWQGSIDILVDVFINKYIR